MTALHDLEDLTPEERALLVPRDRGPRTKVLRLPGARWTPTPRGWVRSDGQTWPHRAPDVLARELARLDALIPCRTPALVTVRLHRVARAAALAPLRAVRAVVQMRRQVVTYERDARAGRPGAGAAAAFYAAQLPRAEERVRGLRVRVPWGGVDVGRGVGL